MCLHCGYYISLNSSYQHKYILIFFIFQSVWHYTISTGGEHVDYLDWFPERLAELRAQKGVSARDMSLSLGQSASYINKIENRKTMPSMAGFFYICQYLGVEPWEFLHPGIPAPQMATNLMTAIGKLSHPQAEHILQVVNDIIENK